jgi:hypothetical protein
MAKAFSVASLNVEHFGALDKRTEKPVKPIKTIIDYPKHPPQCEHYTSKKN